MTFLNLFIENKKCKFVFIDKATTENRNQDQQIRIEIMSYLRRSASDEAEDLSQLDEFPIIRKLFVKYNCLLPSSASVERIFNFAKMILRPQRQRILPSRFEKLLVLKNRGFKFVKRT